MSFLDSRASKLDSLQYPASARTVLAGDLSMERFSWALAIFLLEGVPIQ